MDNTPENALELLRSIDRSRADDTRAWQSICIALKNLGVPYEAFEAWSLTNRHHDRQQIRRAWANLHGNHSIGTLCYYAKRDAGRFPAHLERPQGKFNGPLAFASIIAPYNDYEEVDLECELWERSPYLLDFECGHGDMEALMSSLYEPDDLLFIGNARAAFPQQQECVRAVTDHLSDLQLAEFFRPNPLTGIPVKRGNGKLSLVCDDCVAKFRFAVVEFDSKPLRDQYAFYMAMLDKGMPFAALIHSGNKSIHGLLAVDCPDAEAWKRMVEDKLFCSYLELLGCDGACKNESRMTRTPGTRRSNGKMQKLLYLNPNLKGN